MPFGETKVYFDGSHYIAIPHTTRPSNKREKPPETEITIIEKTEVVASDVSDVESSIMNDITPKKQENSPEGAQKPLKQHRVTRKGLFNLLYNEYRSMSKSKRMTAIINTMLPYFSTIEKAKAFVTENFERKLRNLICRRTRCTRKANLQDFNYFARFLFFKNFTI